MAWRQMPNAIAYMERLIGTLEGKHGSSEHRIWRAEKHIVWRSMARMASSSIFENGIEQRLKTAWH